MTSILRGVDSFDTADAVATDDNGIVGNYEVILPLGSYVTGTYIYPNGRTEADYNTIIFTLGTSVYAGANGILTKEEIAKPWTIVQVNVVSGVNNNLTRVSSTSFSVGAQGADHAIHQVYGYLKEGVI
jgi:hypothetical protein